jgi:hypothetical protein
LIVRKYFSFDPNGDGYCTHKTEQEAKEKAQAALDAEREYAITDGWDEVEHICWGKILQCATETEIDKSKLAGPTDGFVNYKLADLPA